MSSPSSDATLFRNTVSPIKLTVFPSVTAKAPPVAAVFPVNMVLETTALESRKHNAPPS